MLVLEGHKHLAKMGFVRFSAREVSKRIGYSIGTLYNVFGTYDRFIVALNTRTLQLWAKELCVALDECVDGDRIRCLVESYFRFARANRNLRLAIYDHHLPADFTMPEEQDWLRGELTHIMVHEVTSVLPEAVRDKAAMLARSLLASVHGHCVFDLGGAFSLMG